jgi:DNA polymerase III epsilon subunit-like protein
MAQKPELTQAQLRRATAVTVLHPEHSMDEHEAAKRAAAQWARDLLKRPFAIIDTETTGLDHDSRIVSIGVILVEDRVPHGIIDNLLYPECKIPAAATRIHGLTDDMVANALTFDAIYPQLANVLSTVAWAGYNVHYDHARLSYECERNFLPMLEPPTGISGKAFYDVREFDVMNEYAAFWGQYSDYHGNYTWQKLKNAATQQHLPTYERHHAIGDCWTTYHLITKMSQY